MVGGAVHGRELLAARLDAFTGFEPDLDGIGGAPGPHSPGDQRSDAACTADFQAESEIVTIVGPLPAVIAGVDDFHIPFDPVGFYGENRRVQDIQFQLGFDNHEIDGSRRLVGRDARDLMRHLQGLAGSREGRSQRQTREERFVTVHHMFCVLCVSTDRERRFPSGCRGNLSPAPRHLPGDDPSARRPRFRKWRTRKRSPAYR